VVSKPVMASSYCGVYGRDLGSGRLGFSTGNEGLRSRFIYIDSTMNAINAILDSVAGENAIGTNICEYFHHNYDNISSIIYIMLNTRTGLKYECVL
jgi:hypothetical protein